MNRRQMLRATLAPAVVLGVGAGCSEPQPKPGSANVVDPGDVTTSSAAPSPTSSLPAGPLTGAPVGTAAAATRQAVAVPLRVSPATTPAGLDAADLVYTEFAESDTLHLTAVFHSRDAAKIGPVTEIRPVDIRSVSVLRPFVGYDGGPTGFLSQFENSDLDGVTPDDGGKVFSGDYTSTAALLKAAPKGGQPPTPALDHATNGDALAARDLAPAAELSVTVSGGPPMTWRYDKQKSLWVTKVGKTTVTAVSVIVLTMEYRTLEVRKPSFRSLPSANVFGEGAVVAVSGPNSAKGRWRKPGLGMVCTLADVGGDLLHPQPGNAWVIYAPTTAKVTVK
ncbi:DUF3048 domain-containing protein [Micromonospora sp. WMMD1128]|uniref:DUF3048 domain-containing protein n=1 Tax=unclassified Micromonospora TaxID=2617518 RepID=UPI00248AF41B|nr:MULTISPECIES: DUF3048 domain-containing protein [unclassified Micromonospora]WBB73811.1 DUF3048 domain-containing protein [Micromonospora sp. WMMD1128]WFE32784.1 DUF3048 domain-containing protein [Micromonospora sp. WMMD975]